MQYKKEHKNVQFTFGIPVKYPGIIPTITNNRFIDPSDDVQMMSDVFATYLKRVIGTINNVKVYGFFLVVK